MSQPLRTLYRIESSIKGRYWNFVGEYETLPEGQRNYHRVAAKNPDGQTRMIEIVESIVDPKDIPNVNNRGRKVGFKVRQGEDGDDL